MGRLQAAAAREWTGREVTACLPQDSAWLLSAHLVLAANLQQRAGGCAASVTLRALSSFMAWQAETESPRAPRRATQAGGQAGWRTSAL